MSTHQDDFIKKILIPYDFSETADLSLEHAVFMAKLMKAEITLLHIVETVSFTSAISHALSGFEKKIETATNEKLDQLAHDLHMKAGITLSIRTEVGRIYKKICQVAKEIDADIIVMGTHGSSGYQKFTVGTNTSRVVQEAPCPVISVQTHAKGIGFKKLCFQLMSRTNQDRKFLLPLQLPVFMGLISTLLV
ncbi:MAG: universal stress protein [Bacteroidetes bacterium]|nr:universal stress protein [Bacteroidota bacterium]